MERTQAKFFKPDVLHVLLRLQRPVSRAELAASTGLGEGSIRSILDILKNKGFVESSKKGHWVSPRGKLLLRKVDGILTISKPSKLEFPKAKERLCFHIRKPVSSVPSYVLRDIAVKWGASGALIFHFNGKELVMPPSKKADYKEDYSSLQVNLAPGDHIALLWGSQRPNLISGGLEIAAQLSPTISGLFERI